MNSYVVGFVLDETSAGPPSEAACERIKCGDRNASRRNVDLHLRIDMQRERIALTNKRRVLTAGDDRMQHDDIARL